MIDWLSLAANVPWLLGLVLIVSALSYRRYAARPPNNVATRAWDRDRGAASWLAEVGILLVILGVALSAAEAWRRVLSGVLFLVYGGVLLWPTLRGRGRRTAVQGSQGEAGAGEPTP